MLPACATHWAHLFFRQVAERGKSSLRMLFQEREWVGEHCGRSGYRVTNSDKPKSVQLRGSHRYLATIAYPQERTSGRKRKFGSTSMTFDDGRHYFGRDGGCQRGLDVHKEVEDFVNFSPERFKAMHPKVDPLTYATLDVFKRLKLRAVIAEYIVYNIDIFAGTAIDNIAMNEHGGIDLIELKTGYSSTNFMETDARTLRMNTPFNDLYDTPYSRACLQLIFGATLFRHCTGIRHDHLWIIHASPDTNTAVAHNIDHLFDKYHHLLTDRLYEQKAHEQERAWAKRQKC